MTFVADGVTLCYSFGEISSATLQKGSRHTDVGFCSLCVCVCRLVPRICIPGGVHLLAAHDHFVAVVSTAGMASVW